MSGGRGPRDRGNRRERELVARHVALGVHSERFPYSGATRFRGSGHDIDVYPFGKDEPPLVAEVKSRKSGAGFVTLESWLADNDLLFLQRNHADPLIVMPWRVWTRILERVRR